MEGEIPAAREPLANPGEVHPTGNENTDARRREGKDSSARTRRKKDPFELRNVFPQFVSRVETELTRREIDHGTLLSRTDLSRPTLRRILEGKGNPLLSNLHDLAQAIGVPLEELLGPERAVGPRRNLPPEHALLGPPPAGDPMALWIYKQLCLGRDEDDLARELQRGSYPLPGEEGEEAVSRAVLDVFHFQLAWIHAAHVPRDRELEEAVAERFDLRERPELRDGTPVRVIDLPETTHRLLRIFAVAAVAADVSREAMQKYKTLGVGDGFSSSAWQLFLRRGALSRIDLLPLVFNPRFSQFEMSGNAIVGAMMRTHLGYTVGSAIDLDQLQDRLQQVDHAVISCGPGQPERIARLPRLIREAELGTTRFYQRLRERGVVGDLLYRFLDAEGAEVELPEVTGDIAEIDGPRLRGGENLSLVYAPSLERLAAIARRGSVLVQSHQADRAPILRAALGADPRPVNLLVITRAIAEALLA